MTERLNSRTGRSIERKNAGIFVRSLSRPTQSIERIDAILSFDHLREVLEALFQEPTQLLEQFGIEVRLSETVLQAIQFFREHPQAHLLGHFRGDLLAHLGALIAQEVAIGALEGGAADFGLAHGRQPRRDHAGEDVGG